MLGPVCGPVLPPDLKSDPVHTCWIRNKITTINLWIQHVDRRSDKVSAVAHKKRRKTGT